MKYTNYRFISTTIDSELLEAAPINRSFLYSAELYEISHPRTVRVAIDHFALLQKQMDQRKQPKQQEALQNIHISL